MRSAASSENEPRYVVIESELYESQRQEIFLRLLLRNPEYAVRWLTVLTETVAKLKDFPGPLSLRRDEEASDFYHFEVRRLLYYGPGKQRINTPYRVLLTILPESGEGEQVIRVFRILHGSQQLVPPGAETQ